MTRARSDGTGLLTLGLEADRLGEDFWIGEDPDEEGTGRVAALGSGWMGQDP